MRNPPGGLSIIRSHRKGNLRASRAMYECLCQAGERGYAWRKAVGTTNAIERRFREVRWRTRPMGVFPDRTSMDRILFAVFTHENSTQGVPLLFSLTQTF